MAPQATNGAVLMGTFAGALGARHLLTDRWLVISGNRHHIAHLLRLTPDVRAGSKHQGPESTGLSFASAKDYYHLC